MPGGQLCERVAWPRLLPFPSSLERVRMSAPDDPEGISSIGRVCGAHRSSRQRGHFGWASRKRAGSSPRHVATRSAAHISCVHVIALVLVFVRDFSGGKMRVDARALIFTAAFLNAPTPAAADPTERWFATPTGGVQLGWGWSNAVEDVVKNQCLEFSSFSMPGQEVRTRLDIAQDSSSFLQETSVSVRTEASIAIASAKAGIGTGHLRKVNNESYNLIVHGLAVQRATVAPIDAQPEGARSICRCFRSSPKFQRDLTRNV